MYSCKHTTHLKIFSLPEDRRQLTNPKEVPLKRKETPTAPLFPEVRQKTPKLKTIKRHLDNLQVALPKVFPRPVLTLAVCTWLMRASCSGFTNTARRIFQRDCTATYRTMWRITGHFRADQKAPPITLSFYIKMCQLTTPINYTIHGARLEITQIEVKIILKQRRIFICLIAKMGP